MERYRKYAMIYWFFYFSAVGLFQCFFKAKISFIILCYLILSYERLSIGFPPLFHWNSIGILWNEKRHRSVQARFSKWFKIPKDRPKIGAEEGIRTPDFLVGNEAFYHWTTSADDKLYHRWKIYSSSFLLNSFAILLLMSISSLI